jgi:hypothetical protein
VAIDGDTARILRITAIAHDIPEESRILHAETEMGRPLRELKNVVTFTAHRKFEAESKVDFK